MAQVLVLSEKKKSVNVVGSVSNKRSHWKQPFQSRSINLLFGHWVKKPKVKKPSKPPAKLSTFAMLPRVTWKKRLFKREKNSPFLPHGATYFLQRIFLLQTPLFSPRNTPVSNQRTINRKLIRSSTLPDFLPCHVKPQTGHLSYVKNAIIKLLNSPA